MNSWHRTDLDGLKNSRSWPLALFLDDGGVLNDNSLRGPEWLRLIGEFMPLRMGGTPDQWAGANRVVFSQVWGDLQKRLPTFTSHQAFERTYATNWMHGMCARVGVTPPSDDDAVTLYRELSCYIGERASSAIAGAAEAVLSLHRAGYALYTASGTPSWELRGITANMGLADAFSRLYGPDIVDRVKYGSDFYQLIFAHADIAPSRALVIESDAECCRWASDAGAHAVWIDRDGRGDATTLAALVHALL
jgi:beta-phosphoglucomutase-like phosphatase (HAD superfamily)